MKNLKSPAFIMALVGGLLLFIGIGLNAYGHRSGDIFIYIGAGIAGLFWIWSIFKVATTSDLKDFQKRFWLIAVVAVPVMGALIYHVMHQKSGKIIT